MESVYNVIPMEMLPEEYLPDDYTGPSAGSMKELGGMLGIKSSDNPDRVMEIQNKTLNLGRCEEG